jgi:hypothetical protein
MALTFYQQTKESMGQQARYLDFVSQFDFEPQYRPGVRHSNADALSRIRPCEVEGGEPCRQCNHRVTGKHTGRISSVSTRAQFRRRRAGADDQREQCLGPSSPVNESRAAPTALPTVELPRDTPSPSQRAAVPSVIGQQQTSQPAAILIATTPQGKPRPGYRRRKSIAPRTAAQAVSSDVQHWSPEYIADQQARNPDIGPALGRINDNSRPTWDSVKPRSPALRSVWQRFESLVVRNGVLHIIFHNIDASARYYQALLPRSLKISFLE